ncbi:LLM class flavin-dependent oxidoreductase [Sphingobium sp. JS3065]|uniref:LLM class flavin-dependent oxidoreductase n=1 Tax=Sphingobium sp. JS3065 TaxID=2970925 RepID=UPI002263E9FB|nr:LLM class flavin-dependent oxidoreductase [Sphingobium sp. JS3065]UZW53827.1 LLM class flavin-dependent oxidoreductase [Sphingobium sp. JS3065]
MAREIEYWSNLVQPADKGVAGIVDWACRLEADGWHGGSLVDSQCFRSDAFVTLAGCAAATTRLQLGTGTSNPVTRHPSALAAATAGLQMLSKGRMMLGIGRGDSALAHVGASPISVSLFEKSLATLQAYLQGKSVPLETAADFLPEKIRGFDKLALNHAPEGSRLTYLPNEFAKPAIEAACTGPKVIAAAARHADAISFSLGADRERLKWGIEVAREALVAAGRDPSQVKFAAFLPLFPHPNIDVSRKLAEGRVSVHARFSIMNKQIVTPANEVQRETFKRVAETYDMAKHGSAGSDQAQVLSPEFIDQFALTGDPESCIERINAILELGFDRLHLWAAAGESEMGTESYTMAAEKVLPKLSHTI